MPRLCLLTLQECRLDGFSHRIYPDRERKKNTLCVLKDTMFIVFFFSLQQQLNQESQSAGVQQVQLSQINVQTSRGGGGRKSKVYRGQSGGKCERLSFASSPRWSRCPFSRRVIMVACTNTHKRSTQCCIEHPIRKTKGMCEYAYEVLHRSASSPATPAAPTLAKCSAS